MRKPLYYLFGYGSLMYPSGINGRGMRHTYIWDDLLPATINHFQRGMFASYGGLLYYGMLPKKNSIVNGVILPIFTEEDLDALLINEGAHKMYDDTRRGRMYQTIATADYACDEIDSVMVTTLINERLPEDTIIPKWYVAHVWNGIQPWGSKFSKKFLKTGGLKPSKLISKTAFIYTLIKKGKLWLRSKNTAKIAKNS